MTGRSKEHAIGVMSWSLYQVRDVRNTHVVAQIPDSEGFNKAT